VRTMKILELFSGTASFSNVCKARGHEIFTVDNNPQFNPDLCIDIMELTSDIILEKFGKPDIIWASPPCQKFSIMTVYKNWEKIGENEYRPKNKDAIHAQEIVKHTLKLIAELKPRYYFIENPRAMLRKQEFMLDIPRKTITYCQYGLEYQKATDIWTNCKAWLPKPICSANSPCHVRAPRGSRFGVQGVNGLRKNRIQKYLDVSRILDGSKSIGVDYNWNMKAQVIRGIIPEELCKEIIEAIEIESKKD